MLKCCGISAFLDQWSENSFRMKELIRGTERVDVRRSLDETKRGSNQLCVIVSSLFGFRSPVQLNKNTENSHTTNFCKL